MIVRILVAISEALTSALIVVESALAGRGDPIEGEHVYVSTACLHGEHGRCRHVCKFCPARCLCRCHATGGAS